VYDYLLKDMMQCWIMFGSDENEENKVFGIGITRISEMPNYSQLEIVICTGKRRDLWEDQFVDTITKFAKANGCKRLCIWARPGWEKVSKKWGWQKKHVQLEKWLDK
jgi:esterase/lipase superfamily enzyme